MSCVFGEDAFGGTKGGAKSDRRHLAAAPVTDVTTEVISISTQSCLDYDADADMYSAVLAAMTECNTAPMDEDFAIL